MSVLPDMGRWEYDGFAWLIEASGGRGVCLNPNGEIWNHINGPPEMTAADFEAAARIMRWWESQEGAA